MTTSAWLLRHALPMADPATERVFAYMDQAFKDSLLGGPARPGELAGVDAILDYLYPQDLGAERIVERPDDRLVHWVRGSVRERNGSGPTHRGHLVIAPEHLVSISPTHPGGLFIIPLRRVRHVELLSSTDSEGATVFWGTPPIDTRCSSMTSWPDTDSRLRVPSCSWASVDAYPVSFLKVDPAQLWPNDGSPGLGIRR